MEAGRKMKYIHKTIFYSSGNEYATVDRYGQILVLYDSKWNIKVPIDYIQHDTLLYTAKRS